MGVQTRIRTAQRGTAVTGFTGAAPQVVNGNAFPMSAPEFGTLSATAYALAGTANITITGKWQARNTVGSGSWYDVYLPNGAAQVTFVTGTASAVTRSIAAPRAIYTAMEARYILTSGVEAGGGLAVDEASVSYNFRDTLYQRRPILSYLKTAVTGFTGAAPQTLTTGGVSTGDLQPGTLCAFVYAKATTNTLTITGKWQVTNTPNTSASWIDAREPNSPTDVTIVTGTGSAVTDTRYVTAPDSVYGYKFARYVLTTGVGVGGGAGVDEGRIEYQYMRPFY